MKRSCLRLRLVGKKFKKAQCSPTFPTGRGAGHAGGARPCTFAQDAAQVAIVLHPEGNLGQ